MYSPAHEHICKFLTGTLVRMFAHPCFISSCYNVCWDRQRGNSSHSLMGRVEKALQNMFKNLS